MTNKPDSPVNLTLHHFVMRTGNYSHIQIGILQDIHVLDAGCGTGQFAESLLDISVGKLTLLDSDPQMLKYAKQKLADKIERGLVDAVVETKLSNLPFPASAFDAIQFSYVSSVKIVISCEIRVCKVSRYLRDVERGTQILRLFTHIR